MKTRMPLTLLLSTLCLVVFIAAEAAAQVAEAPKGAKVLYFTRSSGEGHSPARMREDGTTLSGAALKKYCVVCS